LPYMEYRIDRSITDLLSTELYNYVEFLPKNKRDKVDASNIIDYMMEDGLILKDNKDTESLTKFGGEVKKCGGWLAYCQSKERELEKKNELNEVDNGQGKVSNTIKDIGDETSTRAKPVAVEIPLTPKPIEQKERWSKTIGKKIVESAIVKIIVGVGGTLWAAIGWEGLLKFITSLWPF